MILACAAVLTACGGPRTTHGVAGARATIAAPRLHPPHLHGAASFAPSPPAPDRPSKSPAQAGPALRGRALPTNQWWTSALVGPWTQTLVAGPVSAKVAADGIALSYRPPVATADHVVQAFDPAIVAGGNLDDVRVERYGAFDVTLRSRVASGGTVDTTLVQGSPVVYLRFAGVGHPSLDLQGTATVGGSTVSLDAGGTQWVAASARGTWRLGGHTATLDGGGGSVDVAVAPAPSGARGWPSTVRAAAADPVVSTTESLSYDARHGVARQVLRMERRDGGPGPWALTPLQRRYAARVTSHGGSYATSLGRMQVADTAEITVEVPAPGFLPGVPHVDLPRAAVAAVRTALRQDLAQPPGTGGSYFGAKEAAREAAIADVAGAIGDGAARRRALALLHARLVDWLTYSGPSDGHYFAYDGTWGGLIGVPAEFGAQDYNDHHLQYGYLVRAAATMAEADPSFVRRYGDAVDAIARDYASRVWDPGLEHSWASGYAWFADGNDQESSSEAVAAWAALARWGLAADRPQLAQLGLARYALEGAAARMYWLGDQRVLPAGYAHRTVGIVWGDKADYATWFSAAPAAVEGIQLLPVGFDGLYRWDASAARARIAALRRDGGITQWSDVFAAEEALYDPAGARRLLASPQAPEPSTSRALARYLVETLAVTGPPDPSVSADSPYGLAMRRGHRLAFLGVDPTGKALTVTFRSPDGRVVGRLRLHPEGGTP